MAKRMKISNETEKTLGEVYNEFILSQSARDISDATIKKYHHNMLSIANVAGEATAD